MTERIRNSTVQFAGCLSTTNPASRFTEVKQPPDLGFLWCRRGDGAKLRPEIVPLDFPPNPAGSSSGSTGDSMIP